MDGFQKFEYRPEFIHMGRVVEVIHCQQRAVHLYDDLLVANVLSNLVPERDQRIGNNVETVISVSQIYSALCRLSHRPAADLVRDPRRLDARTASKTNRTGGESAHRADEFPTIYNSVKDPVLTVHFILPEKRL